MRTRIFLAFICVVCGFASRTQAGYLIQFSATDPLVNHFETAVGAKVDVNIYAAQNGLSSDLTTYGLITMGFSVNYDQTKIDLVEAKFAFSGFPAAQEFEDNPGKLQVYGGVGGANPVGVKGATILLGTLSLQTKEAGRFDITIGDFNPALPSFVDFGLQGNAPDTDFDKVLFGTNAQGTYQFSAGQITAVPEPSSMLLLSSIGMACGGWYRIRKKSQGSL